MQAHRDFRTGQFTRVFARLTAVIVCALGSASSSTNSTDEAAPGVSFVDPAPSRQILQRAGASADALFRFDRVWNRFWPVDAVQAEKYLRTRSRADLSSIVNELSKASPDDQYVPGPDSLPQPGVPKGSVFEFTLDHSHIFPGSTRHVRVYVPQAYTGSRPACVFVALDDLFPQAPATFDNLIFRHEVPTLIAIGIRPGVIDSNNSTENPRFNRSFEFDGLNDNLARFLLTEVFPEVERHRTPKGLPILLSRDPNDRAIGGVSTGGIGAFTVAWERPDEFRRVFTGIGTFVGMRGADRYPVLVRKTEPKPIRIFMQDGRHDEMTDTLGEIGDWWLGNQAMLSALEFAKYRVEHVWGDGGHDPGHAIAVFPDAMRWLWQDWPRAVVAGQSQNTFLKAILVPGEIWHALPGDYSSASVLAAAPGGGVVFRDAVNRRSFEISPHGLSPSRFSRIHYTGMSFGPDGRAILADAKDGKIAAYFADGKSSTITTGIRVSNLIVTHNGSIYITEPGALGTHAGRLWLVRTDSSKLQLDQELSQPTGIAISPDGMWLAVAEGNTHWGYSYGLAPDGSVQNRQRFYWFHAPDDADDSGAGAWVMDRAGRLYAATRLGIQVFDRNGRVRAILPVPGGEVTGLAFGGPQFDTLYVTCADHRIYVRRLNVSGAPSWSERIALPPGDPG